MDVRQIRRRRLVAVMVVAILFAWRTSPHHNCEFVIGSGTQRSHLTLSGGSCDGRV